MIDKDLEVKFHNGSIHEDERKVFFMDMTQKENWDFGDKVFKALCEKSYSSISMAKTARTNIMMNWIKYHPSF